MRKTTCLRIRNIFFRPGTYFFMTQDILSRLFSLCGKRVLVTGAGGGIGRALAIAFAEAGAIVGVHNRSPEALTETMVEIANVGGKCVELNGDLHDIKACQQLATQAKAVLNGVDVLVNCAGMNRRKPISEVTPDDFDTIMNVNLRSAFFLSQAIQPMMAEQGGGKIIHIGSITSSMALGGISVYAMSKISLAQLSKTMALEWAQYNIQVNCLAPGFIDTPLTRTGLWNDAKKKAWILDRTPAKRPGTPADLIGAALFLASPGSDFVTGQVLTVDGGFLAGGWWDTP